MVTLSEILDLPIFREGVAEVVAGHDYLNRPVRWVHAAELFDIASLLRGGELLLTTGMGLTHDPDSLRAYIRHLADARVAALGIELGRTFTDVPAAMIDQAERSKLPLIVFHRETRYVDVTEQVHSAIISSQFALLKKAEAIGKDFTDLVLRGADIRQVLYALARLVKNPVVLEDSAHQIVEVASYADVDPSEIISLWAAHSRAGHTHTQHGHVNNEHSTPPCIWVGIWLREQPWGRLHVLNMNSERLDQIDQVALDRAAACVGFVLLSELNASHVTGRARSALLSDIAEGSYASADDLFSRAESLGVQLKGRRLLALVADIEHLNELDEGISEQSKQEIRQEVGEALNSIIVGDQAEALVGLQGNQVYMLAGLPKGARYKRWISRVRQQILNSVDERFPNLSVSVGVSREVVTELLPQSFKEAREAAEFGRLSSPDSGWHQFDELGLEYLLMRLSGEPQFAMFVEAQLGPLLEHDANKKVELIPTLRAYLSHGGTKASAARTLMIGRRTLYRRLEQIERLLDVNLDDQQTRTRLMLALQALEVRRRQVGWLSNG